MPFSKYRPTNDQPAWKLRLYLIIFESGTRGGKIFDIALLLAIGLSVTVIMLASVQSIREAHRDLLWTLEWTFTILFTCEYIARLLCVRRPLDYVRSLYGILDLFAFLPTYINLFIPAANYLLTIRVVRLLRVFRILELSEFMQESETLMAALYASRRKIAVFISTVLAIVLIMGTVMYLVEGEANGCTSIPRGVYWAVVTLTTVGLWRHHAAHRAGTCPDLLHHDHGLRNHRRAHRHLFPVAARSEESQARPDVCRLRLR
jgi:voltage-gated potassium channel